MLPIHLMKAAAKQPVKLKPTDVFDDLLIVELTDGSAVHITLEQVLTFHPELSPEDADEPK